MFFNNCVASFNDTSLSTIKSATYDKAIDKQMPKSPLSFETKCKPSSECFCSFKITFDDKGRTLNKVFFSTETTPCLFENRITYSVEDSEEKIEVVNKFNVFYKKHHFIKVGGYI